MKNGQSKTLGVASKRCKPAETKVGTQSKECATGKDTGTETQNDSSERNNTPGEESSVQCSKNRDQRRERQRCLDDKESSKRHLPMRRHTHSYHSREANLSRDVDNRLLNGQGRKRSSTSNETEVQTAGDKVKLKDRTSTDQMPLRRQMRKRSSTTRGPRGHLRSRSRDRLDTERRLSNGQPRRRSSSSREPKDLRSLSRDKVYTLSDERARKRSLISREREELRRRKADIVSRRTMRVRSVSPVRRNNKGRVESREDRLKSEHRHREEHDRRQNRSHDTENPELERSRADRKRRHSHSPEHPHSGHMDLRERLERRTKRFKREQSPRVARTSRDNSAFSPRSSTTPSAGDWCPPTPSYGELEEGEFLELEFDELYQCSDEDEELSCPPTPTNESVGEVEPGDMSENGTRSNSVSEDETVPISDCESEVEPVSEDEESDQQYSDESECDDRQEETCSIGDMDEGVEDEQVPVEIESALSDHETAMHQLDKDCPERDVRLSTVDASESNKDTNKTSEEKETVDAHTKSTTTEQNFDFSEEQDCEVDTEEYFNAPTPVANEEGDIHTNFPNAGGEGVLCSAHESEEGCLSEDSTESELEDGEIEESEDDKPQTTSPHTTRSCSVTHTTSPCTDSPRHHHTRRTEHTVQSTTSPTNHTRTHSSSHRTRLSSDCSRTQSTTRTRSTSRHSQERTSKERRTDHHHSSRTHTTRPLEPSHRTNATHRARESPPAKHEHRHPSRHSRELVDYSRQAGEIRNHRSSRQSSRDHNRRDNRRH